jgi:hypothetical protein
MDLQRSSASTDLRLWLELRNRGLLLGTEPACNRPVNLKLSRLATHCQVLGPTGFGKSRWLLHLLKHLLHVPKASIVVINPKGGFGRLARDVVIQEGQENRLKWLRPGDPDAICGYNPMHPNGLPIESHAKSVRESIRSAYGQSSFDQTRQLARMLYLVLVVARANRWGLVEALQLLRPGSRLRAEVLPRVHDHQLKEALTYFHSLRGATQQDLALSAIAMLEPFVTDQTIRGVITHTPSLDLSEVIHHGGVLIVDIPLGQPLRLDDVKLLGRFLTNDLANRAFERSAAEAKEHPVFFIVDEAELFLTEDFCHVLRMGREPGLHAVIAHQDLAQLRAADETGNVYGSVMGSCRTKIVFGGLSTPDCRTLAEEIFIDQWDPMAVKDELTSLEIEPVESNRAVLNFGVSGGVAAGKTRGNAASRSHTTGKSISNGSVSSYGETSGFFTGSGGGQTMLPNGELIETMNDSSGMTGGDSWSTSDVYTETDLNTVSEGRTESNSTSTALTAGASFSMSIVPFEEKLKRRVVSSRTFRSEQEFMTLQVQKLKSLPERHFIVKTDGSPALFCRAPLVPDPRISDERRGKALAKVYGASYYFSPGVPVGSAPPGLDPTSHLDDRMLEFSEPPPIDFWEEKQQ